MLPSTLKNCFKNQALSITHVAFADDIILFYQATPAGLQEVHYILNQFSLMSGQQINFSKS